jgi:rRNA-processing protein FCF1
VSEPIVVGDVGYRRCMRLRHGVTVELAIKILQERISDSQQASASNAAGAEVKRQAYLNWINTTQVSLRMVFSDTEAEDTLLARAYWHICQMSSQSDERLLNRLIGEELVFQVGHPGIHGDPVGRLGAVMTRLRSWTGPGARRGHICVLDTNALLHYTRFDQLPWPARLTRESVRLVIPLVVVDELDAKKYARREEFQQRARELLTLIDSYVTTSPPAGYAAISAGVTVEVLPDEPGHNRTVTADQEILERCEFMQQVTGQPVALITGDSGMRINAQARGIEVFKLAADDLLPRHKPTASETPATPEPGAAPDHPQQRAT